MSSPPGYEFFTATKVSVQKLDNPYYRPSPADSNYVWWARDPRIHVTSTMDKSRPYDHTTPPPSPQTIARPPNPRPTFPASQYFVDPQISPAAACPQTPRLAPCEGPSVAQDASYYPLTKGATFLDSGKAVSKAQYATPCLAKARQDFWALTLPPSPTDKQPRANQALRRTRQRKLLKDMIPLGSTGSKNPYLSTAATTANPKPKPDMTTKANSSWTASFRKRRPSEIFNLPFSFNTPSKRQPSDRTPQISPRTSISESQSSILSSEESPKRQRVDSSRPAIIMTSSPFQGSGVPIMNKYDFSRPEAPAHVWDLRTHIKPWDLKTHITTLFPCSVEPHPGSRVDFSTPRPTPRDEETCSYHTYLEESRRNSSPSRTFPSDMEDVKTEVKQEQLDKEAQILGLTTNPAGRKRALTLERTRSTMHKTPPSVYTRCTRSSSTLSDPSASNFLRHVRASQEARAAVAKRQSADGEGVFVDEAEKGFLGDGPL